MTREIVVDASFYERRPLRVGLDLVRAWGLVIGAIALALLYPHPGVWAGAAVVIGTQLYALEILLHDGLHRTLLSSKASTDWLCRLFLTYPLFTALGPFRWKHLEHHKVLGKPDDPDRYYYTAADKGGRFGFLFFCTGLSAAWSALRALARPRARRASAAQAGWLDWVLIAVAQVAIAALLTWLGGPLAYLCLWVVPFGLFVFLAQSLRSFAEHAQAAPDGDETWPRMVTYRSNPLERMFFAPLNMNYHAEHHLYPQVPYYHLPRLRETLRAAGELDAVEVRGSYLGFLWRYWRSLPHPASTTPAPVGA